MGEQISYPTRYENAKDHHMAKYYCRISDIFHRLKIKLRESQRKAYWVSHNSNIFKLENIFMVNSVTRYLKFKLICSSSAVS